MHEVANRKNTLLGLNPACKDCHEDVHKGLLGANCGNCHNTTSIQIRLTISIIPKQHSDLPVPI